jgi:hypothetical protein
MFWVYNNFLFIQSLEFYLKQLFKEIIILKSFYCQICSYFKTNFQIIQRLLASILSCFDLISSSFHSFYLLCIISLYMNNLFKDFPIFKIMINFSRFSGLNVPINF